MFDSVMVQLKNRIAEPVETLDVTLHVLFKGQVYPHTDPPHPHTDIQATQECRFGTQFIDVRM